MQGLLLLVVPFRNAQIGAEKQMQYWEFKEHGAVESKLLLKRRLPFIIKHPGG
jgi:hypothetical protein